MDRVVWESWHMFVYYDDESIELLRNQKNEYSAKMNSYEPIVVYVKDKKLPKLDTKLKLDGYRINIFHEHYYELLIFLSTIDTIVNQIDNDVLNTAFKGVFRLCSIISKREIKDINTLRNLIIESMNMYRDGYLEYMETGKCDFYNRVPIPFVMMDNLIPLIKKSIGLNKHFSLMMEFDSDISIYTCRAINDYVASRCTGYLSMNVLLHDDSEWKSWYSNNGQFVEYVHDYSVIDLRKHKTRSKNIHN